jgi:hypothetical protein
MFEPPAVAGLAGITIGIAIGDLGIAIVGPNCARRAATRRRRVAWLAATRACRHALPWSVPVAIAAGLLFWAIDGLPAGLEIAAGVGIVAAHLMLVAGQVEARGSGATGRALARLAGQALFAASVVVAVFDGASHPRAISVIFVGGAVALLAGLSAKPRPSGTIAIALFVAGLGALAWVG